MANNIRLPIQILESKIYFNRKKSFIRHLINKENLTYSLWGAICDLSSELELLFRVYINARNAWRREYNLSTKIIPYQTVNILYNIKPITFKSNEGIDIDIFPRSRRRSVVMQVAI